PPLTGGQRGGGGPGPTDCTTPRHPTTQGLKSLVVPQKFCPRTVSAPNPFRCYGPRTTRKRYLAVPSLSELGTTNITSVVNTPGQKSNNRDRAPGGVSEQLGPRVWPKHPPEDRESRAAAAPRG